MLPVGLSTLGVVVIAFGAIVFCVIAFNVLAVWREARDLKAFHREDSKGSP